MLSIDEVAGYWRVRAERSGRLHYVALGDSLAQGYGASAPEHGYVGQRAELIAATADTSVRVSNLGVCGATVREVVEQQLPVLRTLQPDVVTVCIGANDAGHTPTDTFRADFTAVCDTVPAGSFVGDVPDFQGGHGHEQARELAGVCRSVVAATSGLVGVGIEAATTGMAITEFSTGFAHPDDRGYQRYTRAFWSAMAPAL
ncbi:MAG: SGNH/GDSL hydrolase family protein [Mycobacteriaceae bacterium]